jgi:hypothetical protein
VPETQYLDTVIRRKRGELKIAAKMKSKRADSKEFRKRVNLKTCLSEGMGNTTRIAVQCKEE